MFHTLKNCNISSRMSHSTIKKKKEWPSKGGTIAGDPVVLCYGPGILVVQAELEPCIESPLCSPLNHAAC